MKMSFDVDLKPATSIDGLPFAHELEASIVLRCADTVNRPARVEVQLADEPTDTWMVSVALAADDDEAWFYEGTKMLCVAFADMLARDRQVSVKRLSKLGFEQCC